MGFTVKQARQYAGFTQREMAEKLGISRDTYRKIEQSPECATVATAKRISEFVWTTQELMSLALFFQCMENVVRGSQSCLTNAIDSLTIVAKGYPFYAALMDSLLDGLPTEKKEE